LLLLLLSDVAVVQHGLAFGVEVGVVESTAAVVGLGHGVGCGRLLLLGTAG